MRHFLDKNGGKWVGPWRVYKDKVQTSQTIRTTHWNPFTSYIWVNLSQWSLCVSFFLPYRAHTYLHLYRLPKSLFLRLAASLLVPAALREHLLNIQLQRNTNHAIPFLFLSLHSCSCKEGECKCWNRRQNSYRISARTCVIERKIVVYMLDTLN